MDTSIRRTAANVASALSLCAPVPGPARADVTPVPAVAPVAGTAQPFGSNDPGVADMAAKGYVQEEFFISGKIGSGLPYTTRLLVRRPADPKKFSGVVIAESIRSSGHRSMWSENAYLMAHGHAYVEIGSNLSVNTLVKPSDPARYAALNVPNPTPGQLVFGHVQEIAAQAGQLLRSNPAKGPFEGFRVRHVILAGCSEQGMFVRLYMRDAHPRYRTAAGRSVYDGYFPACVGDWPPVVAREGGEPLANFTQPPVEVPTIMVATSEPEGYPQDGRRYRRPDSDAPRDKFRLYEVAAMPHGLDMRGTMRPGLTLNCDGPKARTDFPGAYPANNALDKLIRWVDEERPAPRAARLEVASATGPVLRDEFGNPRGGVRTTTLDVPVATYALCDTGKKTSINPAGIDFGAAYMIPFTPERLKQLYPTPQTYLTKVDRRLDQLVRDGWYLKEDADEARAKAAEYAKTLP
ncbi:alpha/beta hydrolase domain-containing protein [Sphingomonas solaris]|uniref:Alpha/beta hydrolase domain-containing protein n=1 Tax=Alterirhizorhabdus solaris TaxID=2529389 RepID=A0A558R8M0_9SPHN|nr:alpha/beta hydrolase domain-containing protein [Sphingomonas solaris]TVV75739.1 hypothetical protein FOY91_06155 [Sphingomonas solaris]